MASPPDLESGPAEAPPPVPRLPIDVYLLVLPYLPLSALLVLKDASRELSDACRPVALETMLLMGDGPCGWRELVKRRTEAEGKAGSGAADPPGGAEANPQEPPPDAPLAVPLPPEISLARLFLYSLARRPMPPATQPAVHPSLTLPSRLLPVPPSDLVALHSFAADFLLHALGPPPERYTTVLSEWLLYDPDADPREQEDAFRKECGRAGKGRRRAWEEYETRRERATRELRAACAGMWAVMGRQFPFTHAENAARKARRALSFPPPPQPANPNPITKLPSIHANRDGSPRIEDDDPSEFWDPDHNRPRNPKYATVPRAPVRKFSDDPELVPKWRRTPRTEELIRKLELGEAGASSRKDRKDKGDGLVKAHRRPPPPQQGKGGQRGERAEGEAAGDGSGRPPR